MLDTVDIAATTGLLEQISKLVAHATDIFQSLQAQAEATHERSRPRASHFFECRISVGCDVCAGLGAYRVGSGPFRRSCQVTPPSPIPGPASAPIPARRRQSQPARQTRVCRDRKDLLSDAGTPRSLRSSPVGPRTTSPCHVDRMDRPPVPSIHIRCLVPLGAVAQLCRIRWRSSRIRRRTGSRAPTCVPQHA